MQFWLVLLVVVAALAATLEAKGFKKDVHVVKIKKDYAPIKEKPIIKHPVIYVPDVVPHVVPAKFEKVHPVPENKWSLYSLLPSRADISPKKIAKNAKLLKIQIAKYLKKKFKDSFRRGFNLFDFEVPKKMAAYYTKNAYNAYPDMSAAAVQWLYPTITNHKDLYKVYGRSRVPGDKTCPHHMNETIACALQISNPVMNRLLRHFGY